MAYHSDAASLLEIVHEIEPVIRAHGAEAEENRRLSDAVVSAMRERGLYRLWRPKALGGLEVDPMTAFKVFEEVSRIDSAAGWNLQLTVGADGFGPWFPDDGAEEIFSGDAILAGSFFPARKAAPVDGGYKVSGRTPFCSGVHHSSWVLGLANIFDGDTPRTWDNGAPMTIITVCPTADVEIVDNWRTLGMRGTGSHDTVMRDLFVPARRTAPLVPLEKPGRAYDGPLYRCGIWPVIAALSTVAVGVARAALDDLEQFAGAKAPSYTGKVLKDRSIVQAQVGRAEALARAAHAFLQQAAQGAWNDALDGRYVTMPHKINLQLAGTHAAVMSAEVVDLVHAAAGTSGIRDEQRFQRHFRDVHTITQHGFISSSRYESVGQLLLDAPVEWPFYGL